jgi:hypothetical protein
VASIERTAYPRFKRITSVRELEESFTPSPEEITWALAMTRSESHLLSLVLTLKTFQRLGYFPPSEEIPTVVVDHVRHSLGLPDDVAAAPESARTLRHHRTLVRERLGVVTDPQYARKLAESAIEGAAQTKDNPADLINVALEEIVRARCEIPGYTTLDEMASRIRTRVNSAFFGQIVGRMSDVHVRGLELLLKVDPTTRRSGFDALKQPAGAATVSKFKAHLAHLAWADSLGPTEHWLEGIPPAKVAHFAGEARVTDAHDMRKMGRARWLALVASLLHTARIRARDDVVTMFCKRTASIAKKAKDELSRQREQQRADSERLIGVLGDVLAGVREALSPSEAERQDGTLDPMDKVHQRAGRAVLQALAAAGGVEKLSAEHEAISAHHGNNYAPLMERFYRNPRPALFTMLDVLLLETVLKTILGQHGSGGGEDVPALLKQVRQKLGLDSGAAGDTLKRTLSGLGQVVVGVAELRNLYGTGHGRSRGPAVDRIHARLAVDAAGTMARFLLDTWRRQIQPPRRGP